MSPYCAERMTRVLSEGGWARYLFERLWVNRPLVSCFVMNGRGCEG